MFMFVKVSKKKRAVLFLIYIIRSLVHYFSAVHRLVVFTRTTLFLSKVNLLPGRRRPMLRIRPQLVYLCADMWVSSSVDCDWSAFNAILLLDGSVKMVSSERWCGTNLCQRALPARQSPAIEVGGILAGWESGAVTRDIHARHIYEVVDLANALTCYPASICQSLHFHIFRDL